MLQAKAMSKNAKG